MCIQNRKDRPKAVFLMSFRSLGRSTIRIAGVSIIGPTIGVTGVPIARIIPAIVSATISVAISSRIAVAVAISRITVAVAISRIGVAISRITVPVVPTVVGTSSSSEE
jgi:hypothetical protein